MSETSSFAPKGSGGRRPGKGWRDMSLSDGSGRTKIVDVQDLRQQIRIAAARRDTDALVRLLAAATWPRDALQIIGDALVEALGSGAQETEPAARVCSAELRGRGWEGDDILADALDAKLGEGAAPSLQPVPVRLDDVATALEGDEFTSGGRIDLATGDFWPALDPDYSDLDDEDDEDDEEDSEREWLWVNGQGSHDGYRDMEAFIVRLDDATIADLLGVAIQGRGAFRRFKDTLGRWPEQLEAWYAFSEERQLGRARAWLADQGYTPVRQAP